MPARQGSASAEESRPPTRQGIGRNRSMAHPPALCVARPCAAVVRPVPAGTMHAFVRALHADDGHGRSCASDAREACEAYLGRLGWTGCGVQDPPPPSITAKGSGARNSSSVTSSWLRSATCMSPSPTGCQAVLRAALPQHWGRRPQSAEPHCTRRPDSTLLRRCWRASRPSGHAAPAAAATILPRPPCPRAAAAATQPTPHTSGTCSSLLPGRSHCHLPA